MARNFRELESKMAPDRLAAAKAQAKRNLEQTVLSELRRRAGWSPAAIAAELGMDAATYTELQGADDMSLAALQQLVRSLGGELDVVVRLPEGIVSLSQLATGAELARHVGSERPIAEPAMAGVS